MHVAFNARHQCRTRRSVADAAYRERSLYSSKYGVLDLVWTGNRESEPACIHNDLSHVGPWRCQELGCRVSTRTTSGNTSGKRKLPATDAKMEFLHNDRYPTSVQRSQIDLISKLNANQVSEFGSELAMEARIRSFELAFQLQREMPEAERLEDETEETRRLYGLDDPITENFGRQCLLARRFAERGVRFIQVTHSDAKVQWDQHGDLRAGHEKNAKEVDRPIAGLLHDLKRRGLLRDTLVIWGGELGEPQLPKVKTGAIIIRKASPCG